MKILITGMTLIILACGHKADPLMTVPELEQYIPQPVVQMIIINGDTTYMPNQ